MSKWCTAKSKLIKFHLIRTQSFPEKKKFPIENAFYKTGEENGEKISVAKKRLSIQKQTTQGSFFPWLKNVIS